MLTHSVKLYCELEDSKTSSHRYKDKMESQQTKASPSKGTESENGNRTPSPVVSPASPEIVVLQEIDNSTPAPDQTDEQENAEKTDNTVKETTEKANDDLPVRRVARGCCRNCRIKPREREVELPIDKDGQGDEDQNEPCCRGFRKSMMRRSLQFYGKAKHCHGSRFSHKNMSEAQRPCCKSSKEKCGNDFASEEMAGRCKKRGGFKRCFGRRFGNHSDPEGLVGETRHDSSSDNEDTPHDGRHGKKHGFGKCFKKRHGGHSETEGCFSEQNNEARQCHRKRRDIASDTEGNDRRHGKCKNRFQMRHGGHSETEGFTSEPDNEAKKCHKKRRDIASDTEGNIPDGRHEKRNKCRKHFQMRHGGHSETEGFANEKDNQARKCQRKRPSSADESRENRNEFEKYFQMRHGGRSETEESEQDDDVRNCCHKGKQTDEADNAESYDEHTFSGRPDFRQLFWSLMNNQNMHHKGGRFGKMGKSRFGHHMKHGSGHFGKMNKHHFGHHMKHGGGHFGKMDKHHFGHHMKHGSGLFGKMNKHHFGHHMKHGSGLFGKMNKSHFGHYMKHGSGHFGKMDKHHFGHYMKHGGGHFEKMDKHFGHHMKRGHHHGPFHHNSMLSHHHGRHGFQNKHERFGHEQSGHHQRENQSFNGADTMVIVLE